MASDGQGEEGGFLTTTLKYKEDGSGTLVGQCREFPFVIVKGKTLEELGKYAKRHIDVYFKTFPEEAKKIIETHGIHREAKIGESETEWKHEKLNIPLPVEG
jgi:predicted RNase H-like HicB family nuclease